MSEGRAYDWNEPAIPNPKEGESSEYVLLDPGKYQFRVLRYERSEFPGSAKIPPCKQAIVFMEIGGTIVRDNLILHSKVDWKLCQFFLAIGERKHGESMTMNWNAIPGKTGWCKIRHTQGKGDKAHLTYNKIDCYLDPDNAPTPTPTSTPAAQTSDNGFPWESGQQEGW